MALEFSRNLILAKFSENKIINPPNLQDVVTTNRKKIYISRSFECG